MTEIRLHVLGAEEVVRERAHAREQLLRELAHEHAVVGDALARVALGERVERAQRVGGEHEEVPVAAGHDLERVAELGRAPRQRADRIGHLGIVPGKRERGARRRGRDRHASATGSTGPRPRAAGGNAAGTRGSRRRSARAAGRARRRSRSRSPRPRSGAAASTESSDHAEVLVPVVGSRRRPVRAR